MPGEHGKSLSEPLAGSGSRCRTNPVLSYHQHMALSLKLRLFGRHLDNLPSLAADHIPPVRRRDSLVLRSLGWGAAGAGALTLGVVIGRELRQRYKFHRRTPYDFYAHAGEDVSDVEFGVGI